MKRVMGHEESGLYDWHMISKIPNILVHKSNWHLVNSKLFQVSFVMLVKWTDSLTAASHRIVLYGPSS